MKKAILFSLFISLFLTACSEANDSENEELKLGKSVQKILVDGLTRDYILYVPKKYTGETSLPVLFCFHGLGSSKEFNYDYTKFNELAESENFIVIHPDYIDDQWNLSSVDNPDIDFVVALLDKMERIYNIDTDRVYSTGMSNGGNFSFTLACGLYDRIAAIASVTGLFLQLPIGECTPTRPVAVLHIHGTEDRIANYALVQRGLDFWISHNNTDSNAVTADLPDIDQNDGSTVEKFIYANGDENTEVQHLKIYEGGHQWPGYRGNMDISASQEVWNFVKRYNLNGLIE